MARFELPSGEITGGSTSSWLYPDPGIPLAQYEPGGRDPVSMWKSQPSIRKVVSFAAKQVSQLPWHAFARLSDTSRERVQTSPAERRLSEPSKWVSGSALIHDLIVDFLMWDRFCAIVTDTEIVRLPPSTWTVKSDALGRVVSIVLKVGLEEVDLTGAPLITHWGWSGVKAGGISPLVTLAELLDESTAAVKWRRKQWADEPAFGDILRHPSSFKTKEARDRFERSWAGWRSGAVGTPLLEDGIEYDRAPRLDPEKARDIEGRQLTDVEVCGAYHIPPELLGVRPGNFSNMQAFRSMLFGPTLGPTITFLQDAVNRVVPYLDPTPGLYVECSREAAMNGSFVEQAAVFQKMTGAPVMARSEARAKLNLPFKEGTDDLIVPLNVLVGGQASPSDSGSQNEDGADGPDQSFGTTDGGGAAAAATPAAVSAAASDVATIRQQLDALGIAFRAGVKPASAAEVVGLPDLEFFPDIRPITVKLPEDHTPEGPDPSTDGA